MERLGLLGRGFKGDFVVVVVNCAESVQKVCGKCAESMRKVCGKCAESVRKVAIFQKIDILRNVLHWKT